MADKLGATPMGAVNTRRVVRSTAETWTYRLFCSHRGLLYVGIATDLERRMNQHAATKSWWTEVAEAIAYQFPTRAEARQMELDMITYFQPLYNVEGVSDYNQYHADPLATRMLRLPFQRLMFKGGVC